MVPFSRSTATSVPHGGGLHGRSDGDCRKRRSIPYGVPACRPYSPSSVVVIHLVSRNQPHPCGKIVHVDDQQVVRRIEGVAAPRHPAQMARHLQRSLNTRGREDAPDCEVWPARVGRSRDPPSSVPMLRRRRDAAPKAGRSGRKSAVWQRPLLLAHRSWVPAALLQEKPAPGLAIQHIEKARLVSLHHDRNLFAIAPNRRQQRRRSAVVVP